VATYNQVKINISMQIYGQQNYLVLKAVYKYWSDASSYR